MVTALAKKSPSGSDPDSDIIPRLAAGEQSAFSILIDRHISSLSALAGQMLGDAHAAEDITQTVFLKTWQMLPDWEPGRAKLITWMRRVATNLCLDYLRKHRPIYTDNIPDNPSKDLGPEDILVETQRAAKIQAKLKLLPDRQRAALTLFYYQGLSQKESAESMDISVDAFESLLRRGRNTLKQYLQTEVRLS